MAAEDLLDRLCKGWRAYALIALIALAATLPGIGRVPPLDRDESRYAQASLQMMETGDYVRIAVQDAPRNKKPVGIYWLQTASVWVFSHPDAHEIWAYRLPSLLGALLAALATFWGGHTLIGRRAAFVGAALFAASLLISTEGMIAKTDAMLCGLTTLAMAALARLYGKLGQQASLTFLRGMTLVFWAALAGGILIKGPITPLVAGSCLLMLGVWRRKADWMRILLWWPAIALAALIVLPWLIAIGIETHGQFFVDAIGGDMGGKVGGGDEGHFGWPGYHALLVWLLLFPATIALPGGLRQAWRTIRAPRDSVDHSMTAFLIAWAAPTWLVFELLPTKLPHYTLPTYPALALMCGAALVEAFEWERTKLRFTSRALVIAGIVALIAVSAVLATFMPGDAATSMRRAMTAVILGGLILIPALVLIWRARKPGLMVLTACAAVIIFNWSARERILPEARPYLVSQEASNALMRDGLHPRLSKDAGRLTSIGYSEPSFVFLTRTDTRLMTGKNAGAAMAPGEAALVEARQAADFLAALQQRGLTFEPIGAPVVGINYSNGDDVSLQAGRVTSSMRGRGP